MLDYVLSSVFESPAQTLVNTVNTVGVMGKGIAAEFKRRYPDMFRRYRSYCRDGSLEIGKLYLYKGENKWILNFPTKKHWRNPSRPEYLEVGLQKFVETYTGHGITSISFPQLGTGNGGLDWETVVRPLMSKYLSNLAIPVFVHMTRKPAEFIPEHLDNNLKRDLRAPRMEVAFHEFFSDLTEIAEEAVSSEGAEDVDDAAALPALKIAPDITIPGEAFALLWHELRLKKAMKTSEYPAGLAEHAQAVTSLLLRLGYIQAMRFENDMGIRFTPGADPNPTRAVVVAEGAPLGR